MSNRSALPILSALALLALLPAAPVLAQTSYPTVKVGTPVTPDDATPKSYADGLATTLLSGSRVFTGLNAGDPLNPYYDRFGVPIARFSVQGNQNAVVALARNNLAPGTVAFPTALTGACLQDSPGGNCFAIYGEATLRVPGVATTEIAVFNDTGLVPNGDLPLNRAIGIPFALPIALTVSCGSHNGGNKNCAVGIDLEQEGSSVPPVRFLTGFYVSPQATTVNGIYLDATSVDGPVNPVTIRYTGAGTALRMQSLNGVRDPATMFAAETLTPTGTATSAWTMDGGFRNNGGRLDPGGGYVGNTQRATPASGDTVALAAAITAAVLDPAAPIAAMTLTLPSAPVDGQRVDVVCGQTITSLAVNTLVGQVQRFAAAGAACGPEAGRSYRYSVTGAAWFRSY